MIYVSSSPRHVLVCSVRFCSISWTFSLMFGEKDLSTTEIYILKSFDDQLEDEEKIGCFAIIAINVLKMYCCYK